nr:PDZ domain-containing protein [Bacillota bacterium]
MRKKHIKGFLALAIILVLLISPVAADTSFVFRVPGAEGEQQSEAAQKIEMMMDIIKNEYYKDVKEKDLVESAIKGMFEALDPHSTYFTAEEYKEFTTDLSGEIVGIGIQIERKDGRIKVVAPIDGTPAHRAGFMTGDTILEVDGTDVSDYTADQAAKLIRGKIGTKVKIG